MVDVNSEDAIFDVASDRELQKKLLDDYHKDQQ